MQRYPRRERSLPSPDGRRSIERPASQHGGRPSRLPRSELTPPVPTKPKWEPTSVTYYRRSSSDVKPIERLNPHRDRDLKSITPSSPQSYPFPGPGNNEIAGKETYSSFKVSFISI